MTHNEAAGPLVSSRTSERLTNRFSTTLLHSVISLKRFTWNWPDVVSFKYSMCNAESDFIALRLLISWLISDYFPRWDGWGPNNTHYSSHLSGTRPCKACLLPLARLWQPATSWKKKSRKKAHSQRHYNTCWVSMAKWRQRNTGGEKKRRRPIKAMIQNLKGWV